MNVHSRSLGPFETNCYFFEYHNHGFLVDPGDVEVTDFLTHLAKRVDFILLTHGHVDHVLGIDAVRKLYPQVQIALAEGDRHWFEKVDLQASMFGLRRQFVPTPDIWLVPPCEIENIKVIATPGHTPGSVCYFIPDENIVFSGDTLFAGGVGRTDFPGGSWNQLVHSIQHLYRNLPPETQVYPGHGPPTTLQEEKRSNPFVPEKR